MRCIFGVRPAAAHKTRMHSISKSNPHWTTHKTISESKWFYGYPPHTERRRKRHGTARKRHGPFFHTTIFSHASVWCLSSFVRSFVRSYASQPESISKNLKDTKENKICNFYCVCRVPPCNTHYIQSSDRYKQKHTQHTPHTQQFPLYFFSSQFWHFQVFYNTATLDGLSVCVCVLCIVFGGIFAELFIGLSQ